MSQEQSIGVYFSANDKVYDWTIAFLNSFRTFNPDLRLILIPFNEECDRILQLQTQYNFEVYIDPSFTRLGANSVKLLNLGHLHRVLLVQRLCISTLARLFCTTKGNLIYSV